LNEEKEGDGRWELRRMRGMKRKWKTDLEE
jgi:hypothetical protein